MYVGHFAAGLAIKAREPEAPTWALLVGVGLLDILFGPFVLAGIERATVTPSVSPGFSLDYIDWSHSLVMSLAWSAMFASMFARYGRRVMIAIGFAVFSHFLLDLPMHPPDLALWPNESVHLGFRMGQRNVSVLLIGCSVANALTPSFRRGPNAQNTRRCDCKCSG